MPDVNDNPIVQKQVPKYVIRRAEDAQAEHKKHLNELFQQLRQTQSQARYILFCNFWLKIWLRKSTYIEVASQGKQTFQHRFTGFTNNRLTSAKKSRPQTAYRPMTQKLGKLKRDTLLKSPGKPLQTDNSGALKTLANEAVSVMHKRPAKDMRSTIKSVIDTNQFARANATHLKHEALRSQGSKTQNKDRINSYVVR